MSSTRRWPSPSRHHREQPQPQISRQSMSTGGRSAGLWRLWWWRASAWRSRSVTPRWRQIYPRPETTLKRSVAKCHCAVCVLIYTSCPSSKSYGIGGQWFLMNVLIISLSLPLPTLIYIFICIYIYIYTYTLFLYIQYIYTHTLFHVKFNWSELIKNVFKSWDHERCPFLFFSAASRRWVSLGALEECLCLI